MREPGALFEALRRSSFRSRFRLRGSDAGYLQRKGIEEVLREARLFVHTRLSSAFPANDGRQTPMRNHPVFVAQHATATCCRGCLEKWHCIPRCRPLTDAEEGYIVDVLSRWLIENRPEESGPANHRSPTGGPGLFDGGSIGG